jgi:hypothetical protein
MLPYSINKLVHEIQFPDKRAKFEEAPDEFLAGYGLSEEEVAAVQSGDVRALWNMGVNPYLLRVYQIWKKSAMTITGPPSRASRFTNPREGAAMAEVVAVFAATHTPLFLLRRNEPAQEV